MSPPSAGASSSIEGKKKTSSNDHVVHYQYLLCLSATITITFWCFFFGFSLFSCWGLCFLCLWFFSRCWGFFSLWFFSFGFFSFGFFGLWFFSFRFFGLWLFGFCLFSFRLLCFRFLGFGLLGFGFLGFGLFSFGFFSFGFLGFGFFSRYFCFSCNLKTLVSFHNQCMIHRNIQQWPLLPLVLQFPWVWLHR